jgi:hypothetical protein
MRRYQQFCPLTRALDALGDRWRLLIVGELALREAEAGCSPWWFLVEVDRVAIEVFEQHARAPRGHLRLALEGHAQRLMVIRKIVR